MRRADGKRWGRFWAAHMTLLAYALAVFTPGMARAESVVRTDLPREPPTEYDAERWYEQWWRTSQANLPQVPTRLRADLEDTMGKVRGLLTGGIVVGDTLVVVGLPDTARIFRDHAASAGIHYRDTVMMVPEHLAGVGRYVRAAHQEGVARAQANAQHTALVAREAHSSNVAAHENALESLRETRSDVAEAHEQARQKTRRAAHTQRDRAAEEAAPAWAEGAVQMEAAHTRGVASTRHLGREGSSGARQLLGFTIAQPVEGASDTVQWVRDAAEAGTDATQRRHAQAVERTDLVAAASFDATEAATHDAARLRRSVHRGMLVRHAEKQERFQRARAEVVAETFARVPVVVEAARRGAAEDATRMWNTGYNQYLRGGVQLAGDNYFAGDVEGIAVGTFYSVAAVVQGVGFILVLEPMAFLGHLGAGAWGAASLTGKGTVTLAAVEAVRLVSNIVGAGMGVAISIGIGALTTMRVMGTAARGALNTGATAAGLGALTTLTLGGGVLGTAGAGVLGAGRTVGATLAGAMGTLGWSTVGMAVALGSVAVGTGASLGGTATATLMQVAHAYAVASAVVAGTAGLLGGFAAFQHARLLAQTMATPPWVGLQVGGQAARLVFHATVDNAIHTPLSVLGNGLRAGVQSAWTLVEDPVKGTLHVVMGAGGFAFRVTTVTGAAGLTLLARVLAASLGAFARGVHYGMMGAVASTMRTTEALTAPFRFDKQIAWRKEREPQLREMLQRQPIEIREAIGEDVAYVRVVFSGVDRGKVNFFDTEKDGRTHRFHRRVQEDCQVVYVDKQRTLVSGLVDATCVEMHASRSAP